MAEINLLTMSKEIGEKGARYALDEVKYNGLTIRQWADKITGGEYAPIVHGHWILVNPPVDLIDWEECSVCGYENFYFSRFKFCPNCGAKMDEVTK